MSLADKGRQYASVGRDRPKERSSVFTDHRSARQFKIFRDLKGSEGSMSDSLENAQLTVKSPKYAQGKKGNTLKKSSRRGQRRAKQAHVIDMNHF